MSDFPIDEQAYHHWRDEFDFSNFPKGFMRAWANTLTEDEKNQWFQERFCALKYHRYLSGFAEAVKTNDPDLPIEYVPIMGMDFQKNPHDQLFSQFVQKRPGENKVLSDLETLTKKFMILWPRGLFKTSAVIVDIVQTILNYPNVRICFLTGGDQLAKRQLARIKRVFEKPSKRFKFLFPEFCIKSVRNKRISDEELERNPNNPNAWIDVPCKMGNAHEFTIPCRTNDVFAEPTIAISTAKSVKAGSHFDIIFIDDLVNEQNYRSVKALEKCYQDYLDICPLLEPTGFIIMTGTRYSYGDTYERIQEMAKQEEKEMGKTIWKFSIRDCWSYGCRNCEHSSVYHDYTQNAMQPPCQLCGCKGFQSDEVKNVLFPQTRTFDGRSIGHTLEFLEGEKLRLGEEFFANQYENSPIAQGAQTFTETLIGGQTLHDMSAIPPYAQSFTFVVGDLAYVGQEGRDFSVLYFCRLFQGQIFVYACEYGNWDSGQVAQEVVNALLKHRPNVIYLEKFNGWEAYDRLITGLAGKYGIPKMPVQWEKCDQTPKAKLIRIGSVKGVLTSKRIWLLITIKGYDILVKQLVKWPKLGRHDDFADCLGQVVNAPTGYQMETPPATVSQTNWLRKFNQSPHVDDDYADNGCGTGIVCG